MFVGKHSSEWFNPPSMASRNGSPHFELNQLEARVLLSGASDSVPLLHSHSGAPASIYLDFDGDTTARWLRFRPGTTIAYDRDGDPGEFNANELSAIREIWARVAEAYSPFTST